MITSVILLVTVLNFSSQQPIRISGTNCTIEAKYHNFNFQQLKKLHWHLYNFNPSNLWETTFYDKYWSPPIIANLNNIVSDFASQKCFVLVDNYAAANIVSVEHPLVLRRLEPIYYKDHHYYGIRWIPTGTIPRGSVVFGKNCMILQSSISTYLHVHAIDNDQLQESFSTIDLPRFAAQSKPWNCQVHVLTNFYVPLTFQIRYKYKVENFPPIFNLFSSHQSKQFLFSSVPSVILHIMQSSQENVSAKIRRIALMNYGNAVQQNVLLVGFITDLTGNDTCVKNELSSEIICKIDCLLILREKALSRNSILEDSLHLTEIVTIPVKIGMRKSMDSFRALAFPHAGEHTFWSMTMTLKEAFAIKAKIQNLLCGNNEDDKLETPEAKLAASFASIWASIMRNYTLIVTDNRIQSTMVCVNGVMLKLDGFRVARPYFGIHLHTISFARVIPYSYPVVLPAPMFNLRFVSCGKKGKQDLSVEELFIAYDLSAWLMIVMSLLAVAWISSYVMARKSEAADTPKLKWKYLLSVAQVLVEQGDGFSKDFFKIPSLRFALGPFLLTSVIISEGYRNDNVYNLVLPKQLVPYKLFQELVDNNFKIYTKTASVALLLYSPAYDILKYTSRHVTNQNAGKHLFIQAASEVTKIENVTELIRQNSRFHRVVRHIGRITSKYVMKISQLLKLNKTTAETFMLIEQWRKLWFKIESQALFQSLLNCNNTALLIQNYKCENFARRLSSVGKESETSTGNELYTNVHIVFWVTGVSIPPIVARRVRVAGESGIWDFCNNLVHKTSAANAWRPNLSQLNPASMKGNILLVFLVLLVGHVLAFGGFLVERVTFAIPKFKLRGIYGNILMPPMNEKRSQWKRPCNPYKFSRCKL